MKKISNFIIFVFVLFLISPAQAAVNYCPCKPYPIGNIVGRGIQTVTGLNFVASKIAEKEIKKEILKNASGKFDVDVSSYSAFNLASGKLKKITIKGENVCFQSVYLTKVKVKSKCDFMHIDLNSKPLKLLTPIWLDFDILISASDLNKLVLTNKYRKYFLTLKYNNKKLNLFELSQPLISIANNKFYFEVLLKAPFLSGIKFSLESDLKIEDNKINFNNMIVNAGSICVDMSFLKCFLNLINPLLFAQNQIEDSSFKVNLQEVRILNNQIIIKGDVLLPKS